MKALSLYKTLYLVSIKVQHKTNANTTLKKTGPEAASRCPNLSESNLYMKERIHFHIFLSVISLHKMLMWYLIPFLVTCHAAKHRSWLNPSRMYGVEPISRFGLGFTSIESQLFVFGGSTGSGEYFHSYSETGRSI